MMSKRTIWIGATFAAPALFSVLSDASAIAPNKSGNSSVSDHTLPSLELLGSQGVSCTWSALATGLGPGTTDDWVAALVDFNDGGGPALYVGGSFTTAGGTSANHIAKWNGANWSALGTGMSSVVSVLTVFDGGGGPALYAGGGFATAGGVSVNRIARWNGSSWSALGTGMNNGVSALTVFDDGGGGPALYAGGSFTTAGGAGANRIARWNGSSWSALGTGMNGTVSALTVFDDGGGLALYAGGSFTTAGGVSVNRIAKWDGSSWSALGTGADNTVRDLTVFNDGGGPALYAGGLFTTAGGVSANRIAKWNGASWSALATGMNSTVFALTVFDDGGGAALYAGGFFTTAGGVNANRIAKWNGSSWSNLGTAMNDSVFALTVFDDSGGPGLYAGGDFTNAGGVSASHIAKWRCMPSPECFSFADTRVFVEEIVEQTAGSCFFEPAARILGSPEWPSISSPGEYGTFVLRFTGVEIINGTGADLRIWHGPSGCESSIIGVSEDGISFFDLSTQQEDCAGTYDPALELRFTDFDIAESGLTTVQFVRITDVLDASDPNAGCDASDIDALEALNFSSLELGALPYADSVVMEVTGTCFSGRACPLLGPPTGPERGSPGEGGIFTFKFLDAALTDLPGPDLRIWQSDGTGPPVCENSIVSISADGLSFVPFSTQLDDCGGTFDPQSGIYFTDYDMAETGLELASYVRIADVPNAADPDGSCDGSDIDAIEALHYAPPTPIPAVSSWGLVCLTLSVLTAGTLVLRRRRGSNEPLKTPI